MQLGAVTEVVPAGALQARAREVAAMIALNSPAAVRLSKRILWEALDHAGNQKLSNITAILDVNRLGQRGETELGWNTDAYAARARALCDTT